MAEVRDETQVETRQRRQWWPTVHTVADPLTWRKPYDVEVCLYSGGRGALSPQSLAVLWAVMYRTSTAGRASGHDETRHRPTHTYRIVNRNPAALRQWLTGWADPDIRHGWLDAYHTNTSGSSDIWYLPDDVPAVLPNVWLGAVVFDQHEADRNIPILLDTPAVGHFVSCTPLLGPITLRSDWLAPQVGCVRTMRGAHNPDAVAALAETMRGFARQLTQPGHQPQAFIDWVIAGGMAGPQSTPTHPAWVRALRDQCAQTAVPFTFTGWGTWMPVPIVDAPEFSGGRAFTHPLTGSWHSVTIRDHSTKAFHPGVSRLMEPGDRNGHGEMLDPDTIAVRVGAKNSGRELDGRTHDDHPPIGGQKKQVTS